MATVRTAFPDFRVETDELIEAGDKVVSRWTVTGTHKGEYMGIPATGKRVNVTGMTLQRFEDGKIAEDWWAYDLLGFMQQVGAIPPARAA